ncbi:MAG TPA: biotin/lipoyl-containing protein, partial [Chryseolinea sp.]|nr:biotin/lipoyl-containing protein [Chryseolinea sp.]
MALVELIMPKMGESIVEATVLSWLKKPGDKIELEESILEVATDKVDTEIPSTHAGVLKEILAKAGDLVQVGSPIAILEASVEEIKDSEQQPLLSSTKNGETRESVKDESEVKTSNGVAQVSAPTVHANSDYKSSNKFFSPLVKNIAKEENISVAELESISGSGAEGRITKKDILDFVEHRKPGSIVAPAAKSKTVNSPLVPASMNAGDEIVEMDRMRKMIAERMVDSKRIAPHVTSFVEA